MSLDYPDTLIDEALASKSHVHQRLIELLGDVAIGATYEPGNLFKVSTNERVA